MAKKGLDKDRLKFFQGIGGSSSESDKEESELSDSDKTHSDKVESGIPESDKHESDKRESVISESDKPEPGKVMSDISDMDKSESDKYDSDISELGVTDSDRSESVLPKSVTSEPDKRESVISESDKHNSEKLQSDISESDRFESDKAMSGISELRKSESDKANARVSESDNEEPGIAEPDNRRSTGRRKQRMSKIPLPRSRTPRHVEKIRARKVDDNVVDSAILAASKSPKVSIYSPFVAAVLKCNEMTTIGYKSSADSRELLEKALEQAYPDVCEKVRRYMEDR